MIRLSSEQLANIEYQDGTRLMMNNDLEGAVVKFENALNYSPNFRDSNELIYSIQGQLADKYFFESGRLFQASDYMNAYEAIQRALDYRDDYPGAREQLTLIEDKLTKRIAVFPFEAKDLNQSYGDMAAQQLISDLLARNDKFIKVLERQNLEKIFEEQALSQTGAIDEATAVEVGKLTGVNTIVMGTVSLIGVKDYPVSKDTKVGYYNRAYRDVRNVKRERKEKFNYSVYERKRSVEVNINYRMISVETGEILESHSINSEQTDVVNWVDAPKSRLNDLPSSVKSLSTSAQSLKPKDTLVNGALFDASTKVSNFIFTKLNKGGI